MDAEKYKLRKLVKKLETIRGRHTELVSVYVPAGYNLILKISQLQEEAGTAVNIKSKSVRQNVIIAIEKMIVQLRKIEKTPKNGLAIFSGNTSEQEGRPEYEVFAIEPPEPIRMNLYRCDQNFITEPLTELLESKHNYALLVMDLKNSTIAILKGRTIVPVKEMESAVMGKFKAGGQSAGRFSRIRENQIKFFMKEVSEKMSEIFREQKIDGILVGGPGPSKEEFINQYLSDELKKKVVAVKDIGYTGDQGLKELVHGSQELLEKEEIILEKNLVDKFLASLAKDNGLSTYGEAEVWKNLEAGAVDMILLSESLPEPLVEKFTDKANEFGTVVHLISEEFQEGMQLKELGGIAGILRYKV